MSVWNSRDGKHLRRSGNAYKRGPRDAVHIVLPGLRKAACGFKLHVGDDEWGRTSFSQFLTCTKCARICGMRIGGG